MAACPHCGDFDDEPVCSTCGYSTVTPPAAVAASPRALGPRNSVEGDIELDRVLDMLQFGEDGWDESKAIFPMEGD